MKQPNVNTSENSGKENKGTHHQLETGIFVTGIISSKKETKSKKYRYLVAAGSTAINIISPVAYQIGEVKKFSVELFDQGAMCMELT